MIFIHDAKGGKLRLVPLPKALERQSGTDIRTVPSLLGHASVEPSGAR